MSRLLSTVALDVRLQLRHGFYYTTAFIVLLLAIVARQLPAMELGWLLPVVVSNSLIITTFYFVAGLLLLEKGEGTLEALVVTPLQVYEYLTSKVLTLTLLGIVENLIVVVLLVGLDFSVLPLLLGMALSAVLYTQAGLIAVVRYDSINEFLLPSVLYTTALVVPLLAYTGNWDPWLIALHPIGAPLVVMRAAFQPVATELVTFSTLYAVAWMSLGYVWSRRVFVRFVIAKEGVGRR